MVLRRAETARSLYRSHGGPPPLTDLLSRMEPAAFYKRHRPAYRLELLPTVYPYYRRARTGTLSKGDLVYYGPMPTYYGIGEVLHVTEQFVAVDFRGTGLFGVHEEVMEPQYLLPIPADRMALL